MKSWKLKLNFKDGIPNLEKEVNKIYHTEEMLYTVIEFYTNSGLLKDNSIFIEVYESGELKKSINTVLINDNSNKFSY